MNEPLILSNLEEAGEEIASLIADIQKRNGYTEHDLRIGITHAYHHLNVAWNAREVPMEEYCDLSDEQFYNWRAFPPDIDFPKPLDGKSG